jgi:hypothetical protein
VGPTQDGSVIITTPPTITLHLNPYHLLDEAYLSHTPSLHNKATPRKPTWTSARADELHRLAALHPFTAVTNAQRLAHPWKMKRREENYKTKQQHDIAIELWLNYIHDPSQTSPPNPPRTMCWWPAPRLHPIPRDPMLPPTKATLYQCMNTTETLQATPPPLHYLSHRRGRRTATIRAHEPTPCVLPHAPFLTIPGTPDTDTPLQSIPRLTRRVRRTKRIRPKGHTNRQHVPRDNNKTPDEAGPL